MFRFFFLICIVKQNNDVMFYPLNKPSLISNKSFAASCNLDHHTRFNLRSYKYLNRKQQCRFGTTALKSFMLNQFQWLQPLGL